MSDILLLYPKAGHDVRGVSVNAPLALITLAASLLPDFSVKILDQRASDSFWDELDDEIRKRPALVGVTSMTGTQIFHGLEMTKFIKQRADIPIVWGGMHPTIYPAQTVVKPCIDFVISGEGEEAFRSLAEVIVKGRNSLDSVSGLTWKESGKIFATPQGTPINLDMSPLLPWELVNVEEYVSPAQYLYRGVTRLLPYQGSRGCPFKCTFCSEPVLTRKFRTMDPRKMVGECMSMVEKYKLDHITFFDEEFFVNKRWANEVAEEINGRFTWWAQTRANDLLRVDLKRMEQCGMLIVAPGLESGSNRVLNFIKKGETVEHYKEAHQRLSETKIITQYNFIIGFPSETIDELGETIDLVLYLLETGKYSTVNQLSPLTPLPGTELLKQAVEQYGFHEPDRLEDWIQITRGKQNRSWFDRRMLKTVRFLYYTSLFICSAERYAQKFHIPKFVFQIYSKTILFRWKHKWFWLDWEIPLMRLLFRWFINPVDYKLDKKYGDAFTAKNADIRFVDSQRPETPSRPVGRSPNSGLGNILS